MALSMLFIACVLFAGILGSTHAQTGMDTIPAIKITDMMNKSCIDNGGGAALDSYVKASKAVDNCVSSTITELMEDIKRNAGSPKSFESTVNLFCTKVTTLKTCAKNLVDSIKACNKPEKRKEFDNFYRVLVKTSDFICEDKKRIAEAVTTFGKDQCTAGKGEAVKNCMQKIISAGNAADLNADIESSPLFSIGSNEKECRDLEAAEKCVIKQLNACDNKSVAELVTSMFKSINNELPCEKFDVSHASSVGVISIALLTAALAVTL